MTDKHTDIRESLAKITPGPWYASGYTVATEPGVDSGYPPDPRCICHTADGEYIENYNEHDVEFIAAAPTYVRRLLDEVERLEKESQHMFRDSVWEREERLKQDEEIERLRKALEYIAGVPHDWSESYDQAYKTCVKVAVKVLDGGTE